LSVRSTNLLHHRVDFIFVFHAQLKKSTEHKKTTTYVHRPTNKTEATRAHDNQHLRECHIVHAQLWYEKRI